MHSTRRLTYTTLLSTLLSACASAAFAGQIIYSAQSTDYASIQQSPGNNASIMQSYNTNVYPPGGNQPIPLTPDDFGHDGAVINVNGTGNNSAIFQGEDRYDAAAITIVGNNNAASISEQSGYFTSAAGIGNSNNDNIVISGDQNTVGIQTRGSTNVANVGIWNNSSNNYVSVTQNDNGFGPQGNIASAYVTGSANAVTINQNDAKYMKTAVGIRGNNNNIDVEQAQAHGVAIPNPQGTAAYDSYVDVYGNGNGITVNQDQGAYQHAQAVVQGSGNAVDIEQVAGNSQSAGITLSGSSNIVRALQKSGVSDSVAINVNGTGNAVTANQNSNSLAQAVVQGSGNGVDIEQANGAYNYANIAVSGNSNIAIADQTGSNAGRATIVITGDGNKAYVWERGNVGGGQGSDAFIQIQGTGNNDSIGSYGENSSAITQINSAYDQGVISQNNGSAGIAQRDTASINQNGAFSSYAAITQAGMNDHAAIAQANSQFVSASITQIGNNLSFAIDQSGQHGTPGHPINVSVVQTSPVLAAR